MLATNQFNYIPTNFNDAIKYCEIISKSNLCPKDYKDRPYDVFIASQLGASVGLSCLQSLQSIAVINGRPTIWGDAALAIIMQHPSFESIDEQWEGSIETNDLRAICALKRKNFELQVRIFSIADAKRASLWGKQGPWSNYPPRMLQMRARGFALRDVFPDSLKGLQLREEVEDMQVISKSSLKEKIVQLTSKDNKKLIVNEAVVNEESTKEVEIISDEGPSYADVCAMISAATSIEELQYAADLAKTLSEEDKSGIRQIYAAKKRQLEEQGE